MNGYQPPLLKALAVSFLFVSLLAGCSEQPRQASPPTVQEQNPASIESHSSAEAAAQKKRTVVDMAGRTVELAENINRIGTLGSVPMMNTFVESLGMGAKIYNQPSSFHNIYGRWKMHLEFAPQLKDGPHFQSATHELLPENIIAAAPDVCITNSLSITDVLDKLGVPCVYVNWNGIENMLRSVQLLGEVFHQEERAAKYVAYFRNTMEDLRQISVSIPDSQKLRVLYSNPMQFRCPGELTEIWLELAGARSVTREASLAGRREYNLEDLLQWDPEVIFLTHHKTAEELRKNAHYRNIKAVQTDTIVLAPTVGHMWGGHTVEAPVAACWIMHKLYPEYMPEETLIKKIKYFYSEFFSYDMSDAKIREIIAGGGGD